MQTETLTGTKHKPCGSCLKTEIRSGRFNRIKREVRNPHRAYYKIVSDKDSEMYLCRGCAKRILSINKLDDAINIGKIRLFSQNWVLYIIN